MQMTKYCPQNKEILSKNRKESRYLGQLSIVHMYYELSEHKILSLRKHGFLSSYIVTDIKDLSSTPVSVI